MNPYFNEFMKFSENDLLMVENYFDNKAILKDEFEQSLTLNHSKKNFGNLYGNLGEYGMSDYNNMLIEHLKRENEKLQMKLIERGLDIGYVGYQIDRIGVQGGQDRATQIPSKQFANKVQREIERIVLNSHKRLKEECRRIKVCKMENRAYKERNTNQSNFFYRFTNHHNFLGEDEWNKDEVALFRSEIKEHGPESKIDWGQFSLGFRRKTGKQCKLKFTEMFRRRRKKRKLIGKSRAKKKRRFK